MYKSKSVSKKYLKRKNKYPAKTKKDIVCSQIKTNIASSEPLEEYYPARGLFEDEEDIEGKDVFQVAKKNTPKVNRKSLNEKFEGISLSIDAANSKSSVKAEEKRSRSLRLKIKQELANMKSPSVNSDPENSDDDDESDEGSESQSEDEMLSSAVCDVAKRKKYKSSAFADAYFRAQKQKKSGTSNKTLSNLKLEQTSIQDVVDILQNIPEYHKEEKEALFKKYCSQFYKWDCLLQEGFNVLLYGVGSKYNVLKAFCEKFLQDELHVVIHGFFPSLSIKEILNTITEDILEYDGKFSSIQDHCNYIRSYFSEHDENLYVIVHSLDGVPLRSVKTQAFLSSLAAVHNIHFVCSVDHINTPLLWDQSMLSCFQWVWYDTTTFEPYIYETSYDNSLLRDQSSHLILSSLLHVYNSLTPNSRGIFLILAKHQKEEQNKASNAGLTFHEWYQQCREDFLVNSEITMQAQLSEFKNHKLLTSRKNNDGVDLWYIPVDDATLQQFLENCE